MAGTGRAAPHSPQNCSPGPVGLAHNGQAAVSTAPHRVQNLRRSRFSYPQAAQAPPEPLSLTRRMVRPTGAEGSAPRAEGVAQDGQALGHDLVPGPLASLLPGEEPRLGEHREMVADGGL